ncbi:MAG: DUF368 domain-containing protein [Gammaproteobacteria bacterium]|nr:DUF368 domain-containing protein [Gammaproteobacteria bacterium]
MHNLKVYFQEKFILGIKGFCMGAADVIPGVSGGTMALILGIYSKWLQALRSFDAIWVKHIFTLDFKGVVQRPHFGLLIPLAIGVIAAILFFTRVVPLPVLLHTDPEPIYGLFFGLIIGSIIVLIKQTGRFSVNSSVFLIIGILAGWFIVTLVPVNTPDAPWFIFLSGFLAISALLLPGISGSFILLILRKYATVFDALGRFDLSIILPFALGACAGFVVFSRLFTWLLEHFYRPALLTITGLLIGSLWVIWPFQAREYILVREKQRLISSVPQWPAEFDGQTGFALLMMALGLALVLWLNYLSERKSHE